MKIVQYFIKKIWFGRKICLKCFIFIFFTLCVAVIGLVSAAGIQIPLLISFVIIPFISLLISIIYTFIKTEFSHIPEFIEEDKSTEGPYICRFATKNDLAVACKLTKPFYGSEYVSPDQAEQWRIKNNKGFMVIFNKHNKLCASFGILSLKDQIMDNFIEGLITDTQFNADHINNFQKSKKSKRLYISGVIVRDSDKYIGKKRAEMLFWSMMQYVAKFYNSGVTREYYALAVNNQSVNILIKLGAIHINKYSRKDGYKLFKIILDNNFKNKISGIIKNYDNISRICKLEFK
jgi:hypothetical protein